MDSQEQQKPQTVSVSNPYLLRLKCFLCQALNPNVNDENNNLKKENNTNENSFNPISKLPLYTCSDCEAKIRLEEKETTSSSTLTSQECEEKSDRMIIVPDTSSDDADDDECCCQSCSSLTTDEYDSNYHQLWDDLSHIIKCVYRATDKDFSENQWSNDICKAKEYIKKLTEINSQSLFNKLESIVLEYVREIRNQVLERFQTCSKTSHDVQLFISFLLDEYNMFIQAANNVSIIVSYLEEHYMKSFNLTWLLYNKHLYEKLIYMDRKIQHSMSAMIDLLQPSNDDDNDYSPAEYTQLLNRFLAFDEEMSEIACLYTDSQAKIISPPFDLRIPNGYQVGINSKTEKKKKCKKMKRSKNLQTTTQENINSLTTTAVDIPSSTNTSSAPVPPEQGSNGSSIGSGIGGDESSSVSSVEDQLFDNDTPSSDYTQEEQEELARVLLEDDMKEQEEFTRQLLEDDIKEQLLQGILESVSPMARIQREIDQARIKASFASTMDNENWIREIFQVKQSTNEKEQKITTNDSTTNKKEETSNASASADSSSKKSSSSKSKSNKSSSSSHRRKDTSSSTNPTTASSSSSSSQVPKKSIAADLILPRSIADLSAKIQSVSFTAGTFGSITSTNPNECYHTSSSSSSSSSSSNCSTTTLTAAKTTTSTGQTRLSINLTRKPGLKSTEHGGQKIAEALFNEITSIGNGESSTRECLNSGRKKENQQFKKTKQQRSTTTTTTTINETILSSTNPTNIHPFFNSSNKSDSSIAYNNLDHLLRHAASNTDVSEAALHSILSSFHTPTCLDSSSSKHSISSKTTEALQTLLAQQQHHHHQKKNLSNNNNNKHCEFCCCEFPEGRTCSTSNPSNGPIASCVTCMALPGTTTTTSVMGTTITGGFNQRDVEMKERLKLKLTKRNVQNINEQQILSKDEQQKKKQTLGKEFVINDKNNIDDLVRFIDGNETTISSNTNEHQIPSITTTATNEVTSKKKKKDKQTKINNEEIKINSKDQQINQKKQNGSNTTQQISSSSQQSSRSASSSTKTPAIESQQPLSKRKQKAKLKLEQQQKQVANQEEESSDISNTIVTSKPKSSASVTIPSSQTNVNIPLENFGSPEEEVNWITISRKQSKHKPTPPSVPSLLAAPIPPVVQPTNNKQQRQQQQQQTVVNTKKATTTTNPSSLSQQKVIPPTVITPNFVSETISTTHKQQQNTTTAPNRLQNTLKNHNSHQSQKVEPTLSSQQVIQTPLNLWTNNIHEHTPVIPSATIPSSVLTSSTLLATTPSYVPTHVSSSLVTPTTIGGTASNPSSSSILPDSLPSSMYWDPNAYFLPPSSQSTIISSTVPGPVQRPTSSFSPAPGPIHHTTSRCIQRPSPEPRSCSTTTAPFPLYSPMNYAVGSSTSAWSDAHEPQWAYPQEQQQQTTVNDFPLYDPFHSGAGLPIPSSTLLPNGYSDFGDLCGVPQDNDINEMDAFDKEIEDFKKFCFENVPSETREKVEINVDRCFVRQA